jgi:tyrosine-protein kinase Etk/Wzc
MIQNTTQANQPVQVNPMFRRNQADDFIRLQDLFYLCLAKWRWFILSLAVTLGIATYNILTTPNVYQRTASLMIKDDSKSQGISSDVSSMFGDMGLGNAKSNVNNELIAIQSPAMLLETGKRLKLDVDYAIDGAFHKEALYGGDLPVTVDFIGFTDEQSGSFQLQLKGDGSYLISKLKGITRDNLPVDDSDEISGRLGQIIHTPLGKIKVDKAPSYSQFVKNGDASVLYVSRSNIYAMTDRIKGSLAASLSEEKSTVIDLTYKDVLPKRAEDVINTIISVYRKNWLEDKNQMTISTSHFITERLGVIERELGDVDKNISAFKSSNLLPDVEAAAQQYMQKSTEVDKQIMDLNSRLAIAQYIRNYLTGKVGKNQLLPSNTGIESPGIEQQISEYNKRQLERNNLVANSSEQNPLVADYDQSLGSMRKSITASLDNFVVTLKTQLGTLQANEAATTTQIASNPNQAKYLQTVGRQQKVKESLYLFLLQKREENELSKAFTAYNTRIITPATGDNKPVAPVRRNIMLVAFVLGFLIPVVIIFVRENMNTTVRGRKDLKNMNVPFLGEIPYSISRKNRPTLDQRIRFWKKPKEVRQIVVKAGKRDIVNEAFRVLRTNFEFTIGTHPEQNVIVFTSFNPGSGKSHLAANMAMSLAIKKKKVLLIDGDLRNGSSSMLIGSPGEGLSDYLNGRISDIHDILHKGEESGLVKYFDVIPIGTIPPNPTELLFTPLLEQMIKTMRQEYDYVFIDCPPIEVVADTPIYEQFADRTIFVVRSGLMERSMLPEIDALYKEKKFKNMTLILNGTKARGGRYGSHYGYGYGYGYGYNYNKEKSGGKILNEWIIE